jgi:transposase
MVVETSRPIAEVARELGINETSLGNWVRAYRENHAGEEAPLQLSERARLRGCFFLRDVSFPDVPVMRRG